MKFLVFTLVFSCILFSSCQQDSSLAHQEEAYFDVEDSDFSAVTRNQSSIKPIKVFKTPKAITIDGQENDWARAPKRKMRVEIDLGFEVDNKFDLSSYTKMLWDDDNLYVFASILDEEIITSAVNIFEKDGFEIYLDGNNSKTPADYNVPSFPPAAYGNNTDFFRYIPGETQAVGAWGIINTATFETAIILTEDGYNVETRIPFSAFPDFSAAVGTLFGVEFQVNDNDDNVRQHILKWQSDSDFSFLDPSLFDTAELVD